MTNDNAWVIQISPRVGDALVNLRAETGEQMLSILAWYEQNAATIASAIQGSQAGATVAAAFPGAQNVQPQQDQGWGNQPPPAQGPPQWAAPQQQGYAPPPQQAAPAQNQGPSPVCAHGPMQFREGVGKASGKPYKAWFCSSRDRNQQCDPQFIR